MTQYIKRVLFLAAGLLLGVHLTGCQTLSYYGQAICGQLNILAGREPIRRLLVEAKTPDVLKERLKLVLEIRTYAEKELKLPAAGNYLSYVDIKRPYVVWNVFAAPELSIVAKTWCYPVAGCVSYRGYFDKQDALRYAVELEAEGYDVYVAGISAYSTLGWFDDPVLNTFVYAAPSRLAGTIFHELAHRLLYIPGDTVFNESFAVTVEREGLRRWFAVKNNQQEFERYRSAKKRHGEFVNLVLKYRKRFETIYADNFPVEVKRRKKARLFNELRKDYERLKQQWDGYDGYDGWFARSLNNAKLSTVSTYNDLVPAFSRLLATCKGDLTVFYSECRKLAEKPKARRHLDLKRM